MKSFYFNIPTIFLVIILGILVNSNSLFCSFHFDDYIVIINNPYIKDLTNLQNIWDWWPCRFFTSLSLAFNYHYSHLDVFGYHLFNLAIHLVASILVWWLVCLTFLTPVLKGKEITRHTDLISLFSALIFVSHPVQTQAVTFIWQRAASMEAMFSLFSLCFYIKSRLLEDNPLNSHQRKIYYFSSLIAAIMAMFTKETAIMLPLAIVLYEFCFLKSNGDFNWKRISPILLTVLVIPLITLFTDAEKVQSTHSFVKNISPVQYLLTEFRVMLTYIRLVFLPIHQNFDYDYILSKNIFESPVLFSFILLMVILFAARRMFTKYRLISFSIFWFFLFLFPESSFFPFGDVIEEHRLYLPLVGYSILLVSGLYYILGEKNLRLMKIVLVVIIAVNSVLTFQRNKVWKDEITLWSDVVQKSPHKARPYLNLGKAYYVQGNLPQALLDYNKVVEINPKFTLAYIWRGNVYNNQGHFAQALSDYNKAIELVPNIADVYVDRGILYAKHGDLARARSDYDKAFQLNPNLNFHF